MKGRHIVIHKWLLPLSWCYGLGVKFRNSLFDAGILKSQVFSTPVISVGNITVGGTGKTPHVEYLVRLLQEKLHVAVLSRGYKRKSHGFLLAKADTTMHEIGDEPYQMKQKFPDITIAVDKKRTRGIRRLTDEADKPADVILLDDAFQHRYVKPGINILLVDYQRLVIYDELMPAGRLREPIRGKDRADIVIVTKCPTTLTPIDYRVLTKEMKLFPYQQLFFTTLQYDSLRPLFPKEAKRSSAGTHFPEMLNGQNILLLSGIASPRQLHEDLTEKAPQAILHELSFPDHHYYGKKDIQRINETFEALPTPRLIVTTEKDAARIANVQGLSDDARKSIYVLPIKVTFMLDQEQLFNEKIISYVRKNSRNSILAKGKDDYQSKDSNCFRNRPRSISFRDN